MTLVLKPNEIYEKRLSEGRLGLLAIAEDWKTQPLGDLIELLNGAPFDSNLFNRDGRGKPLIRIRDVGKDDTETWFCGDFDEKYVVSVGDVLVGLDGDFRVAEWHGTEALLNQRVCKLVPNEEVLSKRFMLYHLAGWLDAIWEETSATTVKHLSSKTLQEIPFPVPPIDEQRRIVEALDDHLSRLDKALAEIQAADLGLTNLKHASLDSLFMGDSEPFPKATLGSLGKWVTGSTPKTSNPLYQGEDVPFVTPGDIFYGGEILSVRRRISNIGADVVRRLPAPSVQVVCIGATLGKVGYSLEEVTTNQQITSLLPDDKVITAGYAAWLLSSPLLQSLLWKSSSSTTVPILNKGTLEQIEVPLAPLEKQSEILAQIDTQTELSSSLSERTTLARGNVSSLRRSILNRAFSGKLLEVKV